MSTTTHALDYSAHLIASWSKGGRHHRLCRCGAGTPVVIGVHTRDEAEASVRTCREAQDPEHRRDSDHAGEASAEPVRAQASPDHPGAGVRTAGSAETISGPRA
jgi:hypothetical protein